MPDAHWAVDTRSVLLPVQAYARLRAGLPPRARALASITRSLSTTPAEHAITVMPDDPARLIAWLATDEADWITGEVINSEGGDRR